MKKIHAFNINMLAVSMLIANCSYALETLDDEDLQQATAQDGLQMVLAGSISANNVY